MVHMHGCGHPTRPVLMCDDPFCLIESGWLDWNDEHDEAEEGKCICFFCWEDKQKETQNSIMLLPYSRPMKCDEEITATISECVLDYGMRLPYWIWYDRPKRILFRIKRTLDLSTKKHKRIIRYTTEYTCRLARLGWRPIVRRKNDKRTKRR